MQGNYWPRSTSKASIAEQTKRINADAQAIKWRDAKIESITFQLARLKASKFGGKTERMSAQQRSLFEETLAADQASLEAQLAALQPSVSTRNRGTPRQASTSPTQTRSTAATLAACGHPC
ncbi:MAG: transposase [Burkholderiales bacterium]|nr:transposase [Burkholderiales bacterium]